MKSPAEQQAATFFIAIEGNNSSTVWTGLKKRTNVNTYQTWEYCSRPTSACSGLLKTLCWSRSSARAGPQTLGCLGVPFFTAKQELM